MDYEAAIAAARAGFDGGGSRIVAQSVAIKRAEPTRQLVYAEVYVPNRLDAHDEFMTPEDVETMAHEFVRKLAESGDYLIDVLHDNQTGKAYAVESFIARPGDPDFLEGAWVLALKIEDPVLWEAVKTRKLLGLSFETWVVREDCEVEVAADGTTITEWRTAA